jgi:hypothetical protein
MSIEVISLGVSLVALVASVTVAILTLRSRP